MQALQGCHDDIRHMELEQMLDLLQDWFYWPGMTKDVELHIARCEQCILFKSKSQGVAMESIKSSHLLKMVHLDYPTIEATKSGKDVHVFIITDHIMRYA